MLDGRYPSEEFAELRPRLAWDRIEGTLRARRGSQKLAVTNGGTIPDRGLFGVHLPDGRRVGELDEEMVYEARAGQTFRLGSTTWRIEEITRDRVIVTPAPEVPGAIPFWKGDGIGRSYELGTAIGAFQRELSRDARGQGEDAADGAIRARRLRRRQRLPLSRRPAPGDPRGAVGPHDRGRALSRRDRRLAPVRPDAVRRPSARRLGNGDLRTHTPRAGTRPRCAVVGRRRDPALPGRRRAAPGGRRPDRSGGAGGAGHLGAGRHGAVRLAFPRGRRAGAADPGPRARPAHAAVAAAAEGAGPAAGRATLPGVPDRAGDLPRGAERLARPAGADLRARAPRASRDRTRGGRHRACLPVRAEPAVRLHRHLHVRERRAARRAAGRGAGAGP